MKRFSKVVASALCAAMVMSSGLFAKSPVVNAAGVAINSTNFPDKTFREYVQYEFDTNGDMSLSDSEIKAASIIDINYSYDSFSLSGHDPIKSFKGINYLSNVGAIHLNGIWADKLDLSSLGNIYEVNINQSAIGTLNMSNNAKLFEVNLCDCSIENLNLSGCSDLIKFRIYLFSAYAVDASTKEKKIAGDFGSINFSGCSNLRELSIVGNPIDINISSLDLSPCQELGYLRIDWTKLTSVDLSENKALENVNFTSNRNLTEIVLSNNHPKLSVCHLDSNHLTSLNISTCPILVNLYNSIEPVVEDFDYVERIYTLRTWKKDISNYLELGGCLKCDDKIEEIEVITDNPITTTPRPTATTNPTTNPTKTPTKTPTGTPSSAPVTNPTSVPTANPTSVPTTVGPIPTAAPTAEASKSVGSFVDRCYSVALGREADEGGYNYWLDALNNGEICGAQAGYGFIFSGEYANKETTNDEFVTDLYSMYFGRTPDEGGFNYWVGLLNNGASREEIFAGFANSTEFDNLCSDYGVVTGAYIVGVPNDQQGGVNAFVARLYNICLNRRPDMAGQSGWAQKLIAGEVTGTTCAYGFVFSPEFIGKEPSNEDFVAYMYRAFFGREADEAGFTAWVSTLNDGGSYEDVFNGFTGSAEFANLCAGYGIQA
ncbi:MAG: DUF4214 domain-containing protein [Clostridia bacterium]|nr:DUF4214 domain-containing protein [Clostridia bacterium]